MPGPVFLDGERVALRTVEPEDVPFLHRWSNDPAMRRVTGEQTVPLTVAEERRHYEEAVADDTRVLLLVCVDAEPVGALELTELDREADVVELAYWIVPDHRGRGLGHDGVARMLQ